MAADAPWVPLVPSAEDGAGASFRYFGREEPTVAGKEIEVEHHRLVGDQERDGWFDMAGH